MKFGKNLLRVVEISDPEWVPYWINYKLLKKMIKKMNRKESAEQAVLPQQLIGQGTFLVHSSQEESARGQQEDDQTPKRVALFSPLLSSSFHQPHSDPEQQRQRQQPQEDVLGSHPSEVAFFRLLHSELQKSIRFFDRIQEEYSMRVSRLNEGSRIMQHPDFILVQDRFVVLARSAFKVYKDLLLLEMYGIMTYCAFSKILKKHDKVTGRNTRSAFMTSMVNGASFADTTGLQMMIRGCEERYNEASAHLEQTGRKALQEDEILFLSMVSHMNNDAVIVAEEEGAPVARKNVVSRAVFGQQEHGKSAKDDGKQSQSNGTVPDRSVRDSEERSTDPRDRYGYEAMHERSQLMIDA